MYLDGLALHLPESLLHNTARGPSPGPCDDHGDSCGYGCADADGRQDTTPLTRGMFEDIERGLLRMANMLRESC